MASPALSRPGRCNVLHEHRQGMFSISQPISAHTARLEFFHCQEGYGGFLSFPLRLPTNSLVSFRLASTDIGTTLPRRDKHAPHIFSSLGRTRPECRSSGENAVREILANDV